jgi:hypothetical protein
MRVQPCGAAIVVAILLSSCVLPERGGQSIAVGGSSSSGGSQATSSSGASESSGGRSQPLSSGERASGGDSLLATSLGGSEASGGNSQSSSLGGSEASGGNSQSSLASGGSESSSGSSQGTLNASGGTGLLTGNGGAAQAGASSQTCGGGGSSPSTECSGGSSTSPSTACNCGTGGAPSCPSGSDVCDDSGECIPLDSPQHCGSCSNSCETSETSATTRWRCNAGVCSINECKTGFGNCDGVSRNGCEVSLVSDPLHCGGCTDRVCDYPSCVDGECSIVTVCGNHNVPTDLGAAPFVVLRLGSVLGLPQTLNPNDAIVSFGAVTTTMGLLFRAKFQMALYDSDDAGMPRTLLVASDSGAYSDGSPMIAVDGLVEKKLSRPYQLSTSEPRTYWIMLWVASDGDLDVITSNQGVEQEVRMIEGQSAWPSGDTWIPAFGLVKPTVSRGIFPHVFVKYVPGSVR